MKSTSRLDYGYSRLYLFSLGFRMNWHNDPQLESLRNQLVNHKLYQLLDSPKAISIFMQHHVWCVWDFQSLLKALQIKLTCMEIPWLPSPDPLTRRLINEIVLGEESDEDGIGGYLSHFELYIKAMKEIHADTKAIDEFIVLLRTGVPFEEALFQANAPASIIPFVTQTIKIARSGALHSIAAAFTLGRKICSLIFSLKSSTRPLTNLMSAIPSLLITSTGTLNSMAMSMARWRYRCLIKLVAGVKRKKMKL